MSNNKDNPVDVSTAVQSLVRKAEGADKSDDALKFSQAACNAANAMAAYLYATRKDAKKPSRRANL